MDIKLTVKSSCEEMTLLEMDLWFLIESLIYTEKIKLPETKKTNSLTLYVDGKKIPRPRPCNCEDCC